MARKSKKRLNDDLVAEAKKRFERGTRDSSVRDKALEDIKFTWNIDGDNQWDDKTLQARRDRPNYTFNRTLGALNQVIGDQRQNKPSIKVRGIDSQADPKTAEVLSGLIRNIEASSDAETAYDTAFKMAASGGFGLWTVRPEYASDDTFEQDIRIIREPNPFRAVCDPSAKDFCKRDANWWIISDRIDKDEFRRLYPDATTDDVAFDKDHRWISHDGVRVAQYWRRVPRDKTLALLSDGRTVLYDEDFKKVEDELAGLGITVKRRRNVKSHVIEWTKITGAEVLEGPIEYDWKYIPVVPVYGRTINIEGEENYEGIARHARDAQKAYNYSRSTAIETIASQPKSPWTATAAMIKGYEEMYRTANAKNYPYLLYNIDPESPQARPSREPPPTVPVALINQSMQDADDIRATTGFYAPSLGEPSNETSGIAIGRRQTEGDVGSFEYIDNLGKAIKFTGELLVDMIPKVYDTERQVRILGIDGAENFVTINQTVIDKQTGTKVKINDLTTGKYDVAVSLGPSFTTQRQEAQAGLLELAGVAPLVAEVGADLIADNLDMPGAEKLEKRIKTRMIQAGTIMPDEEDEELMREINAAIEQQNQLINAELEREKMEQEAQLQREQIAAQGDIEKEKLQLATAQERAAAERAEREAEAALEREKMALEMEKIQLEREKLALEASEVNSRIEANSQAVRTNDGLENLGERLVAVAEMMGQATSNIANAADTIAAPRELIFDDDGFPTGSIAKRKVN